MPCPACDYPLAAGNGADGPTRCPECSHQPIQEDWDLWPAREEYLRTTPLRWTWLMIALAVPSALLSLGIVSSLSAMLILALVWQAGVQRPPLLRLQRKLARRIWLQMLPRIVAPWIVLIAAYNSVLAVGFGYYPLDLSYPTPPPLFHPSHPNAAIALGVCILIINEVSRRLLRSRLDANVRAAGLAESVRDSRWWKSTTQLAFGVWQWGAFMIVMGVVRSR